MFKSTLNKIPNGVLLIDIATKAVTFANKEILEMIGSKDETSIKDNMSRFMLYERMASPEVINFSDTHNESYENRLPTL